MRSILSLALLTAAIHAPAATQAGASVTTTQTAPAISLSVWQSPQAQQVAEPSAKQLSVNGTAIRYWEQGSGVPVVFVHGAISDHRAWEFQREAIAKRYRYVAIDRRYYGAAAWPDNSAQLARQAGMDRDGGSGGAGGTARLAGGSGALSAGSGTDQRDAGKPHDGNHGVPEE